MVSYFSSAGNSLFRSVLQPLSLSCFLGKSVLAIIRTRGVSPIQSCSKQCLVFWWLACVYDKRNDSNLLMRCEAECVANESR